MFAIANFELALGAIATAHAAMNALDRDEDTTRLTDLGSKWFRCKMCAHGVREMVFEDLVSTCSLSQPLVEHSGPTATAHIHSSATARGTPRNPSRMQVITTTSPNTRNRPNDCARSQSSGQACTTVRSYGTSLPVRIAGFTILRPKRGPSRRGSK